MYILEQRDKCYFDDKIQTYPRKLKLPYLYILEKSESLNNWVFALDLFIDGDGVNAVETALYERKFMEHSKLDYAGYWVSSPTKKKGKRGKSKFRDYCAVYRCFVALGSHSVSEAVIGELLKSIMVEVEYIDTQTKAMQSKTWLNEVVGEPRLDGMDAAHYINIERGLSSIANLLTRMNFEENGYKPMTAKQFCQRYIGFRYGDQFGLPLEKPEDVRMATFKCGEWAEANIVKDRLRYNFANGTVRYYSSYSMDTDPHMFALSIQDHARKMGVYLTKMNETYKLWLKPLFEQLMYLDSEADVEYQLYVQENLSYIDDLRQSEVSALNPQLAMGSVVRPYSKA